MLMKHTTDEIKERSALTVNPAKTCQPIGAMYAALGINHCFPHSHGSQGCAAYHRSTLTRHFKEPVIAGTSSFTEGASVFGGQANLLQAINNIFSVYNPEVIAVHTTCLSETIGDDLNQITRKAREDGKIPDGKYVVHTSTPSYVGSHVSGFANMTKSIVEQLAEKTGAKNDNINLIPGFVEPSDMQEMKRIASEMGLKITMVPDTSNVMNGPQTGKYNMYPEGGAKVEDIKSCGDSRATVALGEFASAPAAKVLDTKMKVPCHIMELPIGLQATDRFVDTLRTIGKTTVPDSLLLERGQLLDVITDMQQYLYGKKVALIGDPDHMIALTEFLLALDMKPVHIITGTPGKIFMERIKNLTKDLPYEVNVKNESDLFLFHQLIKKEPVDLIFGNTYTKYISRDEDIPAIRFGFPIMDRVGHSYFPYVGYKGAIRLIEKMLDAFLARQDRDAPEESFELVM